MRSRPRTHVIETTSGGGGSLPRGVILQSVEADKGGAFVGRDHPVEAAARTGAEFLPGAPLDLAAAAGARHGPGRPALVLPAVDLVEAPRGEPDTRAGRGRARPKACPVSL